MPTGNELVANVRDLLDEAAAAQWTDVQLLKWLNEGNRDLARATRHYKDRATLTLTANVSEYAASAATPTMTIVALEHAYYGDGSGRLRPLVARHFESMDQVWGQWQNQAYSEPQYVTTWGFTPNLRIKLFPAPTVTAHTLQLLVSRLPADITAVAQADVPAAWYDALADYCEMKALRRDRDPRWTEAKTEYVEKRDGLIHNNDYLAVNRELVPDPQAGYLPAWLVQFDV